MYEVPIQSYFLFEPNWDEAYTFSRGMYDTRIIKSITGKEQRNARRGTPRYKLSFFVVTATVAQSSLLRRMLRANLHIIWGVPIWNYDLQISLPVNKGSTTINVLETRYRELDVFSKVMIGNILNYEIVDLYTDTIPNTSFDVTTPLTKNWRVGTRCYPILPAEIDFSQVVNSDIPHSTKVELVFSLTNCLQ